jgi:hypothetical protein
MLLLTLLGIAVPVTLGGIVCTSQRLLSESGRSGRRRGELGFALLFLGLLLFMVAGEAPGLGFGLLVAAEVLVAGVFLLLAAAPRSLRRQGVRVPWRLLGAVVLAAAAAGMGLGLARQQKVNPDLTFAPFYNTAVKSESGFGPQRRALFRCAQPSSCEGPHYVIFNTYTNNPRVGDEREFLAVSNPYDPDGDVVDVLSLGQGPRVLTLRAFIDNNTYQHLPGRITDAVGTRLRVALPEAPTYETKPTAYLYARNAHPRVIWDTVSLFSVVQPARFDYVEGSTELHDKDGVHSLPDGIASQAGVRLGRWRADFLNAGYVLFQVRLRPEPEPVRNPQLTRAIGGEVVYPPPVHRGLAREPLASRESAVGDRFSCTWASCQGPPFPELNAYDNHPLLGDEADFIRGAPTDYRSEVVKRYRPTLVVQPGDEVNVRVAIDNGGDPSAISALPLKQLVARDVRARVLLPASAGRELFVSALLDSSNARPRTISDSLVIRSPELVRLRVRPETVAVLRAQGVRPAAMNLFARSDTPLADRRAWGVPLGDVPPSFSKVVYVQFYLEVLPGA